MNRIKELRTKRKLQQKDIAIELSLPITTYAGYERGEREPNAETWHKLAQYFDVTIGYLMGYEE